MTFTIHDTTMRHTYCLVPHTQYLQLHTLLLYALASCYIWCDHCFFFFLGIVVYFWIVIFWRLPFIFLGPIPT